MKFLNNSGLYIHFPFCKRKCAYCDFYSLIGGENLKDEYLSALLVDIKNWGGRIDRPFDTVYIGGGTPSFLGKDIETLLKAVKDNFNLTSDAEITAEVNPDVSDEFLSLAKENGVNRISIGIQSGNDQELKILGRTHSASEAKDAVNRIKKAGFNNISADLMIALANSNLSSLKSNLDFFLSLNVPHISSYILKIEEKTKFSKFTPSLPNDDEAAEQYLFMCEYLEKNGYLHYEISNFAKDGYFSRHNLKYWECKEYLGLGPSAHSFLDGKRFFYERDIKKYINCRQTVFDCIGGDRQEKLMLGLRLKKGIDLSEVLSDNIVNKLAIFVNSGLIELNGTNLSLTDKGMLVSNSVITELSELLA
ncbi:MAG: radical SAM family heme chaperone HemW [Clostridia bacterium]|nr:radical SAM family heme chaperone HemW [Clostridia bacterium]